MCGIVGLWYPRSQAGTYAYQAVYKDFMDQALYVGALRGMHGTGLFGVNRKTGEVDVQKRAMAAADFLSIGASQAMLKNVELYSFLVGHNRHATYGDKSHASAHPFTEEHITLVHNGTLSACHQLEGNHAELDSLRITKTLAAKGLKEAVPRMVGSYSLVWWDAERMTLNFFRNQERPMFFGQIADSEEGCVFGSELDMLIWLTTRNKIKISKWVDLDVGTHLQIGREKSEGRAVVTAEKVPIPEKKPEPVTQHWTGGGYVLKDFGFVQRDLVVFEPLKLLSYASSPQEGNVWGTVCTPSSSVHKKMPIVIWKQPKASVDLTAPYAVGRVSYIHSDRGACPLPPAAMNRAALTDPLPVVVIEEPQFGFRDYNTAAAYVGKNATRRFQNTPLLPGPADDLELDDFVFEYGHRLGDVLAPMPIVQAAAKLYPKTNLALGPAGVLISPKIFDQYVSEGCVACGAPISIRDQLVVGWTQEFEPICNACQRLDDFEPFVANPPYVVTAQLTRN